jgi:transcriptional regulator with XRE-family HTH domain
MTNLVDRHEVAKRIRQARERLNLSQVALAQNIHVSRRMLQKYEAGQAIPRGRVLVALCKVLNRSLDWILFGETHEFREDYEEGEVLRMEGSVPAQIGRVENEYKEGPFPEGLLRRIIKAVEKQLAAQKISLAPEKKADLIITLCRLFRDKPIDPNVLQRLINLAK